MKRRETRLDIELDVIQPIQATQKQLQLDKPPDNEPHINDPLDLYFTAADYVAGAANDELWTARGDTCDNARSLAINFLESLMLNFCIQLHSSRVLLVASVLYDAILSDICVTLRDVYYRDVALFNHQRVVDKIVDDLVATAGLRRDDFRVFATGKGLMASKAVKIKLTTGEELSLSSTTPTLIPRGEAIQSLEAPDGIEWILVVEKDAVLQTLCSSRLLDDLRLGPGILVTGKGFPDLSTLQLLRRMADQFPCARICALVDADPHGIGIMAVYAYSSKANRYSEDHSGLALCSRIEYLGFKPTEWSSVARYDELVEMSARDVQLAKNLCVDLADVNPEWRRELVQMLHLNRKAELQVLSGPPSCDGWAVAGRRCLSLPGSPNRLIEYIVSKLSQSKCCLHQKVSEPARTDTLGPSRQTA
ncbi:hypothetical protein CspeluHIS016_0109280 [Cutaneotrichosporon spelunceum]|uniref:DNA topoisomerase (ATP-hydrolyzing) n=1 Tax=Cutaneotrichosporon spelunceum TaxID=1672016 RepID=A0AAD3TPW3_9TREE|nr:hypothetical protein CspeluHIS016_0109280 [Cutaneotrichosporon spelunceum]